jgi:hypothetical protein
VSAFGPDHGKQLQPNFACDAGASITVVAPAFPGPAHFGRVESLGGGFSVDTPVPASFTSSTLGRIDWHYQDVYRNRLSVRIAPW